MAKTTIGEDLEKLEVGISAMVEELKSVALELGSLAENKHIAYPAGTERRLRERSKKIMALLRSLGF